MTNATEVVRTQASGDGHGGTTHLLLTAENLLNLVNATVSVNGSDNAGGSSTEAVEVTSVTLYDRHVPNYPHATLVTLCVLLGCMIVATVLGNVFVITAILVERSLQGVSNYLVLSLAVTDLLVAVLVMPLSLLNEVSVYWYLGRELCDMWVSMDVLCCTASILHLVAIAVDRFWAVSNIDYVRRRCARQILLMIASVWLVSVAISIPPLFGWRHPDNPELSGVCMISQDHGYTIFSTVGAFYCPLVLMLVLNFKIYRAARYRIRRKGFQQGARPGGGGGGGRGLHVPVPAVHVEEDTAARAANRNSSGSDVSQDGISMFSPSCMVNRELSRVDAGFDSTSGDYDHRFSYYPGDSTTDSNGQYDSYYPVSTEDPDLPLYPFPTFTVSPDGSDPAPDTSDRLCVESHSELDHGRLSYEHRTLSANHLTVSSPSYLTVPGSSFHRLSVPDVNQHNGSCLTVPDMNQHNGSCLTVPDMNQHNGSCLIVPEMNQHNGSCLIVPDMNQHNGSCLTVPDMNQHNGSCLIVPEMNQHNGSCLTVPDMNQHNGSCLTVPNMNQHNGSCLTVSDMNQHNSSCLAAPDMSQRNGSCDLDSLKLQECRHLAVPESSEIDIPEPIQIIVPDWEAPTTADSRLVQFNSRVRVEGDTDVSETSNSLKAGEDEYLPCDIQVIQDDVARQDERRNSADDTATGCCANNLLSVELSCMSSSNHNPHHHHSPQPSRQTVEPPVVIIRKDSCSHFMSDCGNRGLGTPSFHSFSSPSTTTTTTGSGTYQGGNQLCVPHPGMTLPQQQHSSQTSNKTRANNNTKRARNREKEKQRREKLEMRRERKAARVLGIITGAFVLCWLPFFILALLGPFLPVYCHVPPVLMSLFLWLGYFNSLINPIIYTVFNPSFRNAFRKIFFKRLRSVTRS